MRSTISQRSDNSRSRKQQTFDRNGRAVVPAVRRVTLADGSHVRVVDALKSKTTEYFSLSETKKIHDNERDPGRGCAQLFNGDQVDGIVSHEVVGGNTLTKVVSLMANGERTLTQWLLPALNCTVVRQTIDHAGFGLESTAVLAMPPDRGANPALFEIPSDYLESKPSIVMQKLAVFTSVRENPATAARVNAQQDEAYYARQPKN
jgi:hypothetical protein